MASAGESANRSLRVQVYQELKQWLRRRPVPERITLPRRLPLNVGGQASVPFLGAYIAVLMLALGVFTIATAPAWVMASVVEYASQESMQMGRTEGSFWHGKAASINYRFKDGSGRRLQNFTWEVLPAHLLRGEMAARVTLADNDGTLDAIVGMRGSRPFASSIQASFPATLLRGAAPLLELWSPGGMVKIEAGAINLNPLQFIEPAKARWQGATLTLSPVSPLGDYELGITPQGDRLALNLQTTSGALLVNGSGQYTLKSGGEFIGKAQAAPGFDEPLAPLLQIMGQAAGDGSVNVLAKLPALP